MQNFPPTHRINKLRFIVLNLIFAAYLVCWSPIVIVALLSVGYGYLQLFVNEFDTILFYTLLSLAPLNSVGNPLVFLIFNYKMFRKEKQKPKKSSSTTECIPLT